MLRPLAPGSLGVGAGAPAPLATRRCRQRVKLLRVKRPEAIVKSPTDEERRFLLQTTDAGMVAFNPREDHVIARLLDLALIEAEMVDSETVLLRLTQDGYALAGRLRDNMG